MSTIAPDVDSHLDRMAALTGNPRDNFGSAADSNHLTSGGYHCGAADLKRINAVARDDYSIRQPRDRAFYNWELAHASDLAAAIDYDDDWHNGGRAAWLRFNNMLRRQLGAKDPALAAVRGINYSPDGTAKRRFDCLTDKETSTTDTVTWHTHLEWWRDTAGQASRARAIKRIEQITVAAIHNTPLPVETPAAAAKPQEGGTLNIVTLTDEPPASAVDVFGVHPPKGGRVLVTPRGFVSLAYGEVIGYTNAGHGWLDMTFARMLAWAGLEAESAVSVTLSEADKTDMAKQVATVIAQSQDNELTDEDIPRVADAVAAHFAARLATVQP
jgi:hypothetical protein